MENTEYIDDYFNEPQTPEQKLLFEQKIEQEELFAGEVAFYISATAAVTNELAEQKKKRFKEIYEDHKIVPAKIIPIMSKWRYIAAASVIAAVVIFSWILNSHQISSKQLADKYIDQNFKTLGVTMGSKQDSLQTGLNYLNNGKLSAALLQFEKLTQADSTNDMAIKYAGIAALKLKEYNKALQQFTKLEQATNLYSNPGKFYKAVTLMERNKEGDKQAAKLLLQEVIDGDLEGKKTATEWLENM